MSSNRAQRRAQALLRGHFTSVARTYAKDAKITVALKGRSAYIDLETKQINMPGSIEYLEGEPRKAMEGILDHEVGPAVEETESQKEGWRPPSEIFKEIKAGWM